MQENQEKYDENLKVLCKTKEELQSLNKKQNQQLKKLIAEKNQQNQTLNGQSTRSNRENTSQMLDLNDNNIRNTKQLEPVPQKKERLCHACGSEKHEIKDFECKRNNYIIDLKRHQIIEHMKRTWKI